MATWSHELYRTQWQEHVGIRSGGCGRDMWACLWLCPHFTLPELPDHSMVPLTLKMSFPVSYCPTYSSFLETSPHIHPVMPFTSPGHLSIQYTDKTGDSSFSRRVTHPLGNRVGEQIKSWLVSAAQARCTTNLETMWDRSSWLHRLLSGHSRT